MTPIAELTIVNFDAFTVPVLVTILLAACAFGLSLQNIRRSARVREEYIALQMKLEFLALNSGLGEDSSGEEGGDRPRDNE